jgi:nicotinamide-nucleotide amidase
MAPGRNPSVGDTAEDTIIKIRIRASAPTTEKALSMIAATKAEIRSRIGDVIFGEDDDTLESVVVALLAARGLTVAAAESCTGGLVSTRITDVPDASAVFTQSVVSYSKESKIRLLNVCPELIETHGAVSDSVARAMAEGVRTLSGADFGISTTGIAGPSGGTDQKPVGLVYIAVAAAAGTDAVELRLRGDRAQVRDRATKNLLNMLRKKILAY